MTDAVKSRPKRRYHAPQRAEQAAATRRAVLEAARELFTTNGYAGTTIGHIAERAGVAVDTLYATVGRKPVLLREVFETALSGQDVAVPAEERDYVRAIRAAPSAREKIAIYAGAITRDRATARPGATRAAGRGGPGPRMCRTVRRAGRPAGGEHAPVRRRPAGHR